MTPSQIPGREDLAAAFIVGFPRSGTTWLQRLLATHPSIASPQETFLFSRYLGPQIRTWTSACADVEARLQALDSLDRRIIGLPTIIDDVQFREALLGLLNAVIVETVSSKPGSNLCIEKTPDHANWLDEISWLLPGARVVHVVRTPEQAIASLMHAPWARRIGQGVVHVHGRTHTVDDLARQWRRTLRAVRRAAEESSLSILEVGYDDLRQDTAAVLAAVLDHLGVSSDEAVVAAIVEQDRTGGEDPLILSGVLQGRLENVVEPDGFDRRTRSESPSLTDFERWRVERVLGDGRRPPSPNALRHLPAHVAMRFRRRR